MFNQSLLIFFKEKSFFLQMVKILFGSIWVNFGGVFSFVNPENVPKAFIDVATSTFCLNDSDLMTLPSGCVTCSLLLRHVIKAVSVMRMTLAKNTPHPMAISMISACDLPSIETLGTGSENKKKILIFIWGRTHIQRDTSFVFGNIYFQKFHRLCI